VTFAFVDEGNDSTQLQPNQQYGAVHQLIVEYTLCREVQA
jgi:hypothetical protein